MIISSRCLYRICKPRKSLFFPFTVSSIASPISSSAPSHSPSLFAIIVAIEAILAYYALWIKEILVNLGVLDFKL